MEDLALGGYLQCEQALFFHSAQLAIPEASGSYVDLFCYVDVLQKILLAQTLPQNPCTSIRSYSEPRQREDRFYAKVLQKR